MKDVSFCSERVFLCTNIFSVSACFFTKACITIIKLVDSFVREDLVLSEWPNIAVPLETGIINPTFVGTGFFIGYKNCPCLVTNEHVIKRQEIWYRTNLDNFESGRVAINVNDHNIGYLSQWFTHPSKKLDLALAWAPVNYRSVNHFEALPDSRIVTEEYIIKKDEQLVTWGFPRGEGYSPSNSTYPVRTTGKIIDEDEDTFIIQTQLDHGSSGSPVFVKTNDMKKSKLLGIIQIGNFEKKIASVIKAKYIMEIIETEACQKAFIYRFPL